MSTELICLGCGWRRSGTSCAACGATLVAGVAWKRVRSPVLRTLGVAAAALAIGVLLSTAAIGNLVHMFEEERQASAGRWLAVLVFVTIFLGLGALCTLAAAVSVCGRRWQVFGNDGAVSGLVHTLFGRCVAAGVLHFDIQRHVVAPDPGLTSADIERAGADAVTSHSNGRLKNKDTTWLIGTLMGLLSQRAATMAVATMRIWSKESPWRRRRSLGPMPTLLVRRLPTAPGALQSLPPRERAMALGLERLESRLAPQHWFQIVDVLREASAGLASGPAETQRRADGPEPEAIGAALGAFFDDIGGDTLRLTNLPVQHIELLSLVGRAQRESRG